MTTELESNGLSAQKKRTFTAGGINPFANFREIEKEIRNEENPRSEVKNPSTTQHKGGATFQLYKHISSVEVDVARRFLAEGDEHSEGHLLELVNMKRDLLKMRSRLRRIVIETY
ncbi:hypothetical protein [Chroococcidiopsis thermalis]|uniref:Uncharacterized protein n=1 Tax=Chroococcidiopsis thermalis (strain PCC 7203) TaxID=251229 RepID=K9TWB4_CHRTP|nr:hypothetical protein [Chroococcidiopsis thermalis]AFY86693.1 hypothetical protein Chro_1165 [Chroococcidiopsis thermalis PCC 7203]